VTRPDGIGTVLREEWDKFLEVKDRMRQFLEHQITNFRYAYQPTFRCVHMSQPTSKLLTS